MLKPDCTAVASSAGDRDPGRAIGPGASGASGVGPVLTSPCSPLPSVCGSTGDPQGAPVTPPSLPQGSR